MSHCNPKAKPPVLLLVPPAPLVGYEPTIFRQRGDEEPKCVMRPHCGVPPRQAEGTFSEVQAVVSLPRSVKWAQTLVLLSIPV
jgi:hypothetical protein